VARLVPAGRDEAIASGARGVLLDRLRRQEIVHAGRWTRDELCEVER
jgi:hypothetical protein